MVRAQVWHTAGDRASAVRTVMAHRPGPAPGERSNPRTNQGVRCLRVRPGGRALLSGGTDGAIHEWDIGDGDLTIERLTKT
eukprot:304704-Pyramimonas_sp.AAC.1